MSPNQLWGNIKENILWEMITSTMINIPSQSKFIKKSIRINAAVRKYQTNRKCYLLYQLIKWSQSTTPRKIIPQTMQPLYKFKKIEHLSLDTITDCQITVTSA